MVNDESDTGSNEVCRQAARRRVGPLLFGWSLLALTKMQDLTPGPLLEDLPGEDPRSRLLHWMAHCGVGGTA